MSPLMKEIYYRKLNSLSPVRAFFIARFGDSRGMALLMTLWIGVLLAVVGAGFALSMRTGLASTRNFKEDIMAYYHAVTAYEDAVRFLLEDEDRQLDFMDMDGRMVVEEEGEAFEEERELEFGDVSVRIHDESAAINLNAANQAQLIKVLEQSGVEDSEAEEIADAILDWLDPDDAHRINGAEDDYYEDEGYEAKNGPFSTVEELLLVKGMDEDILYGNAERELTGIYRHFSVCNSRGINVNTVTVETMTLLGLDYACIESIQRLQSEGPILSIPCGKPYLNTMSSNCFRIRASATPAGTDYTRTIEVLVNRVFKSGAYEIQVIQWRDDVS